VPRIPEPGAAGQRGDDSSLLILAANAASRTPSLLRRHPKHVMRNPEIPRSWLFVFSVVVALTGCTAVGPRTEAGVAARGSLELQVGYGSERPVGLRVPAPDVNADLTRAIKEIESRRKAGPLMPDQQGQPAGPPSIDHDVTEGIQALGADKALKALGR
jgi:hypothetical protein